ncbi:MAG: Prolyl oligopeptidase family protein [Rhodanobacteraceae bacterium]|jgi:dipeptidyl aminopeptidase/acylaminoacyl peptidase|nr:MAG: Prolyl oligopeptidase family protein [Rhodanobacteraceae bacterium]
MKLLLRCALGLLACGVLTTALADPVSFSDLARHARYRMVKISPDGTHIAATSVLANGQTVLSLIDLKTRKGANITPREGDDVQDFWWASSNYVVYNEAEHDGGWDIPLATGELYSVEADGGSPTMLYGYRMSGMQTGSNIQHATAENGTAQFLARIDGDPDHILAVVTSWDASGSAGALNAVYRMDVRNGNKIRVTGAPMREASFLADHHGHVRFAMGDDLSGNRVVYMRPADGGDWELLQQASGERDWPLVFSADDKTVWFACPGAPGLGVCRFDPVTRKMTNVWSNPRVEATGLARGLAEDSVIGVEFTDGRPAVSVFDNQAPGVQALVELMKQYPGEDVQFVSGTDDGSKAIALVDADVDPGTFFLYDKASNAFTPLLQRAPWIDPNQLGRADPFTFKTRDGLTEEGYVTYPPGKDGAKDLPMVVFVHGGPYGVRDTWEYDPYVQAMATRGYAVLQVNFRGSGGYGFDFEKAGWRQWGGKMQDDVTDATRWAIAQGIADKDRICIYGGSYGGYAALEGAVSVPDLYKCAIGYVGVYDLTLMYRGGSDAMQNIYGKDYLKRVLGTDMTALAQHSPIYQLDNLKARVMLVVGGRDTRVPPVQGMDMHIALLKKKIAHEWLYKPDEWHGFYDEKNIAELFAKVDAFLDANIGSGAAGKTALVH